MKSRKEISLFLCLLPIMAFTGLPSAGDVGGPDEGAGERSAAKAPDFTLDDLDGKRVSLEDYRGKIVLLVFSATWCPHCRAEIPRLKKLYSDYREKGLVLLNIDVKENKRKVGSFARKNELPYRVLLDSDGTVTRSYGVRGVPTLILIGRDGVTLSRDRRAVDTLLKERLKG